MKDFKIPFCIKGPKTPPKLHSKFCCSYKRSLSTLDYKHLIAQVVSVLADAKVLTVKDGHSAMTVVLIA